MKLFLLLSLTYRHTLSLSPLERCTYCWRWPWPWGFLPLGQACSAGSWGRPALVQGCAMGPETTNLTVWPTTSQFDQQPHSLTTSLTVWPTTSQFDQQPHSLTNSLTVYLTSWFQTVVFGFSDGQFKTQGRNTMNSQQVKTYLCRKTMNTQQGRKTMNTRQEHNQAGKPWTHKAKTAWDRPKMARDRPKLHGTGQNKVRPKMTRDRPKQHRTGQNSIEQAKTALDRPKWQWMGQNREKAKTARDRPKQGEAKQQLTCQNDKGQVKTQSIPVIHPLQQEKFLVQSESKTCLKVHWTNPFLILHVLCSILSTDIVIP